MRPDDDRTPWKLFRGQRLRLAAAVLALGASLACLLLVPVVVQEVLDGVLPKAVAQGAPGGALRGEGWLEALAARLAPDPSTAAVLALAAGLIVILTTVGGALQYLRGRWSAVASEGIVRRLRDALYEHITHLPCSYHDRHETGDLVQRCSSDVETVRVFLSNQLVEIGRASAQVLIALPILIGLDVRMTWVSLALFPLLIAFCVVFFRRVQRLFRAADEAEGRLTSVIQENLTGIRVVRAFARQDFEREKFGAKNRDYRDCTVRLIDQLAAVWATSDVMCFSQIGLVLFAGAYWLQAGTLSVGTFFAFMTYETLLIWPVRHMGRVLADASRATVAMRRIREVLSVEPESGGERVELAPPEGRIEVEDLVFGFAGGEPVLDGVSFAIEAGRTLALIGPPGSGKSALVQLLTRLYDYDEGSIRIDGRELRELDRRWVRRNVGAVLQEPFLYSRTIAANLRVGRHEARRRELVASAKDACVHDAIEAFEGGYETLVGERGVTLSGGQRQRVALARALLKDPPILILDDALSAVDTDTEARIIDALRRRNRRRTTILVAHRLSTVKHADLVIVLDHGRVVQSGTHDELVRADGPYGRLWRIQTALEQEIEAPVAAKGGAS